MLQYLPSDKVHNEEDGRKEHKGMAVPVYQ